eukprot:6209976-Pleurochrysis_carterae.AAC.5
MGRKTSPRNSFCCSSATLSASRYLPELKSWCTRIPGGEDGCGGGGGGNDGGAGGGGGGGCDYGGDETSESG